MNSASVLKILILPLAAKMTSLETELLKLLEKCNVSRSFGILSKKPDWDQTSAVCQILLIYDEDCWCKDP